MDLRVARKLFRVTLRYPEHDDLPRREPHEIDVWAPNEEVAAKKAAVLGRRHWRGGLRWEAEILRVEEVSSTTS